MPVRCWQVMTDGAVDLTQGASSSMRRGSGPPGARWPPPTALAFSRGGDHEPAGHLNVEADIPRVGINPRRYSCRPEGLGTEKLKYAGSDEQVAPCQLFVSSKLGDAPAKGHPAFCEQGDGISQLKSELAVLFRDDDGHLGLFPEPFDGSLHLVDYDRRQALGGFVEK